jgi:hypothetical protein
VEGGVTRFEDLSAEDQKAIRQRGMFGSPEVQKGIVRRSKGLPLRCEHPDCAGEAPHASLAAAERHADRTGHSRIGCVLDA